MSEYEFSQEQNQTFSTLSSRLSRLVVLFVVLAGVRLIGNMVDLISADQVELNHIGAFLITVGVVVLGILLWRPTNNLKRIVASNGRDITELMTSVSELNTAFGLIRLTLALILVFVLLDVVELLLL